MSTHHHNHLRAQRGLTLIELMVAIGLGLVVITLVLRSYATVSLNAGVNSAVSEYQTNGRYALEALKREIRHAALRPMVWKKNQLNITPAAQAQNYGCGAGTATGLFAGLEASNDSNPYATSCLLDGDDRNYARGDVLMVRRTDLEPAVARVDGVTYARLAYGVGKVFLGNEAPPVDSPPYAFDYRIVNEVFFINEFTRSADEQPKVPALYRLTLPAGTNPVLTPQLVASNVEHFQVQFGRLSVSSGDMQYFNANSLSGADWESVTTARIWLLIRASSPEAGMVSEDYELGDVTYTPQDNYRRTVLTSTINLRNM